MIRLRDIAKPPRRRLLLLVVLLSAGSLLWYIRSRLLVDLRPAAPRRNGRARPEFFEWATTSYFRPVASPPSASTSDLCHAFPTHLLETIQPVLKMGYGEDRVRIESQLDSVSACIPDLLVFSDVTETIRGRPVYDILADLPQPLYAAMPAFASYTTMQTRLAAGLGRDDVRRDTHGWELDRFKFLPMVERAWEMRPHRKWYFFYETDTYVVWDNLFRMLENLDPDTPHYMGSITAGHVDEWGRDHYFVNGGPGFVISRAAMRRLLDRRVGVDGDFLDAPLSHRWANLVRSEVIGDAILGWVMHTLGVPYESMFPLWTPHSPAGVPFDAAVWCKPVVTLHKLAPSGFVDLWRWEQSRRVADQPLLYKDLFAYLQPASPAVRADWDNADWDPHKAPAAHRIRSFAQCADACAADPRCFQYNWHLDRCLLVHTIRLGAARSPEVGAFPPPFAGGARAHNDKHSSSKTWAPEQLRYMSGWLPDRIDAWARAHTCPQPQWVRPSQTRRFESLDPRDEKAPKRISKGLLA